jgi:hypothetical protein
MIFIDNFNEFVSQIDGQYYSQYFYFIKKINEVIEPNDLLSVSPNYTSIEAIILSNNLTYKLVDPKGQNQYSNYYYIDFLRHIDSSSYDAIGEIIQTAFLKFYTGRYFHILKLIFKKYLFQGLEINSLHFIGQESRVGEYGNNITRLFYKIKSNNMDLDTNIYAPPNNFEVVRVFLTFPTKE